ncbi:MAG TPA: hypothetical protein VGK20_08765 [Candidatus Binatia bacterium]
MTEDRSQVSHRQVSHRQVSHREDELLQSIEQDEETLREAVHELAQATEQKLDVTRYIGDAPIQWLAGAFCLGFWLGFDRSESAFQAHRRRG